MEEPLGIDIYAVDRSDSSACGIDKSGRKSYLSPNGNLCGQSCLTSRSMARGSGIRLTAMIIRRPWLFNTRTDFAFLSRQRNEHVSR